MRKNHLKLFALCMVCIVFIGAIIAVAILGGKKSTPEDLTDAQKIQNVLAKTGGLIEKNNRNFVNSYNSLVDASQDGVEVPKKSEISNYVTYISSGVGEPSFCTYEYEDLVQDAISTINYYTQYYAYFEYFNDVLDSSFLNKTIFVDQNIESDTVWAKFTYQSNYIELDIMTSNTKGSENNHDYMTAKLYFDTKTLVPTRLDYIDEFVNIGYEPAYKYSRQISFDFVNSTFEFVEVELPISVSSSSIYVASDEAILEGLGCFDYYKVNFNDFSKFEGAHHYTWGDKHFSDFDIPQADKEVILSHVKSARFGDFANHEMLFDIEGAMRYEQGNEAVRYGQNKYTIERNGNYLVARQSYGIDSYVISAMESFEYILRGNRIYANEFDNFSYTYEENGKDPLNIKTDLTDGFPLSNEDVLIISNWMYNEYNENEYYYKDIVVGDFTFTVGSSCFEIRKNTESEDLYMQFRGDIYGWSLECFKFTQDGLNYYQISDRAWERKNYSTPENVVTGTERQISVVYGSSSKTLDEIQYNQYGSSTIVLDNAIHTCYIEERDTNGAFEYDNSRYLYVVYNNVNGTYHMSWCNPNSSSDSGYYTGIGTYSAGSPWSVYYRQSYSNK